MHPQLAVPYVECLAPLFPYRSLGSRYALLSQNDLLCIMTCLFLAPVAFFFHLN